METGKLLKNGYRVGDRIRKKSGKPWSLDFMGNFPDIVTVTHYRDNRDTADTVLAKETETTMDTKDVELVSSVLELDPDPPSDRNKTSSDGGSTSYYTIPDHATELRHLISHKGMSKARGDIFKACYRLGEKDGVDVQYDLNKMKFFIQDLIEMNERGEHL